MKNEEVVFSHWYDNDQYISIILYLLIELMQLFPKSYWYKSGVRILHIF
jgi:hypothetical protein